jgi:hypothetical protein
MKKGVYSQEIAKKWNKQLLRHFQLPCNYLTLQSTQLNIGMLEDLLGILRFPNYAKTCFPRVVCVTILTIPSNSSTTLTPG